MKRLSTLALVVLFVLAANAAVYLVVEHNAASGVYPPDADSIGMPIFGATLLSIVFLVLLVPAVLLAWRESKWQTYVALTLSALASLVSLLCTLSWLVPNHYLISAAYACITGIVLWMDASLVHKLASNNRLERTRAASSVDEGGSR
jgi:hypothetical protein